MTHSFISCVLEKEVYISGFLLCFFPTSPLQAVVCFQLHLWQITKFLSRYFILNSLINIF